jgi:plasmid maintenance system antidote protein VapI
MTAMLLARVLKTSAEFWMNIQVACDLYKARKAIEHAA